MRQLFRSSKNDITNFEATFFNSRLSTNKLVILVEGAYAECNVSITRFLFQDLLRPSKHSCTSFLFLHHRTEIS